MCFKWWNFVVIYSVAINSFFNSNIQHFAGASFLQACKTLSTNDLFFLFYFNAYVYIKGSYFKARN